MRLRKAGAVWAVEAVYAGGAAEAAGVHRGDVIAAINGKSRADHDRPPVNSTMTGPIGSSVNLTLVSGGATREVSLVLSDIL
jgi:C-terminal processing protease CtpA/Prc